MGRHHRCVSPAARSPRREPPGTSRATRTRPSHYGRLVTSVRDRAERFAALHSGEKPLLLVNAWDQGSARLFASLGYQALATTSSGAAATLGRFDGTMTREEAMAHAGSIVAATDLPVSADLEDGFAGDPDGVADTVRLAVEVGLAGCSIEDSTRDPDRSIHPLGLATDRVAAAAGSAHGGPVRIVLTARAENHIHGRNDLADTIARLQAFQEAGADVLYAPGLVDLDQIRAVVASVDRPVNVLVRPNGPTVAELADVGVRRLSVGGAIAFAALGAAAEAARALIDTGTCTFWPQTAVGIAAARAAFAPAPRPSGSNQ